MNPRRLYRCRHDRQLAGVAAGMAEYLDLDPTLVRVLWILSVFLGGVTIVLYVILAFVMPLEPATMPAPGWPGSPAPGSPAPGSPAPGAWPPVGGAQDPDAGQPTEDRATSPAWPAPGPGPRYDPRPDAAPGRGTLIVGVVLVVFGAIAMANALIPGWAGHWVLGPALLVALGIALVVGSARRTASDR